MDGLEAARRLRECCPKTNVLILTATDSEALLREAVNAGAAGCRLKTVSGEQLCRAVRDVAAGMFPVDHSLVYSALTNQIDESNTEQARAAEPGEVLTGTEREVLTLIARGMSNREIAERLVITSYTARAHVGHILRKLGVMIARAPPFSPSSSAT
jgi:DNA-binding NarL/FixJ family response regulator